MAAPKKILLVDDEPDFVFLVSTRLEINGYSVITAQDGEEALKKTKEEKPDLIILDLGLPAGGGFHVLENLKLSVNTSDIPVLVLTAREGLDLEERAKMMGSIAYFHKPFDPQTLLSKIKEILNK